MTAQTAHEVSELFGVLGGFAGILGSLLLAFPLFHLLRARNAVEDLENIAMAENSSSEYKTDFETSARDLRIHIRQRRWTAIRVGIVGVVLLVLAAVFVIIQGVELYG